MKFRTAYLQLTGFYVLIVMTISIVFSVVLYNISSNEIGQGLGRQTRVFRDIQMDQLPRGFPDFEQLRAQQIEETNNNLQQKLIYFNLLILIVSSLASYFLAQRTMKPIEDALESQNRFTADASHELRTPLTAMRTEIEVALRDEKIKLDEAKGLLKSNLEEIEKLESLSGALLKLARAENKTRETFQPIILNNAVAEAYEKVSSLAEEKSIEISYSPAGDDGLGPLKVKGDHQSLVELLIILLDNAIKYSPKVSKVDVTVQKQNKHAVIKVKDRGIGIKASDLPYIFNRFYRADTSRSKEKINGYGLGLSIAKQIVDLHGGTISVTSRPGKGSEFLVKLPVVG